MQTVLGLVIHRFDIHIKRETGCFDVRGSRSQGTAEVAHFFFFFFLLTQHTPGGLVVGVGAVGSILLGTGCTERQWVGNSDTPSLIRCNLNNHPPTHTHFSTHQPPTYARPLRIILKLTPIFIPPYLTNIKFTPLVPVCLLPVHPVPLCVSTHTCTPFAPLSKHNSQLSVAKTG